jgi:hypothetical protein
VRIADSVAGCFACFFVWNQKTGVVPVLEKLFR